MSHQLLQIYPSMALIFRGRIGAPLTATLKLTNPSPQKVCYKIKTTAPLHYIVIPKEGIMEPGSSTTISITHAPREESPKFRQNVKVTHKFMVQSTVVVGVMNEDIPFEWKDVDPAEVMVTKLRCQFEFGIGSGVRSGGRGEGSENDANECEVSSTSTEAFALGTDANSFSQGHGRGNGVEPFAIMDEDENLKTKEGLEKMKTHRHALESSGRGDDVIVAIEASARPLELRAFQIAYLLLTLIAAMLGVIIGKYLQ